VPLLYTVAFVASAGLSIDEPDPAVALLVLHVTAIVLTAALFVLTLVDIRRNGLLDRVERRAWTAAVVVATLLAVPAYTTYRYTQLRRRGPKS
jgi:NADH:ubiquinone oxidoreductase subunit 6 (subunit J)